MEFSTHEDAVELAYLLKRFHIDLNRVLDSVQRLLKGCSARSDVEFFTFGHPASVCFAVNRDRHFISFRAFQLKPPENYEQPATSELCQHSAQG